MKKQNNKPKHKNILRNINITITAIVFVLYVILFQFLSFNKHLFIMVSIIANIYIFFLHYFILVNSIKYKLNDIKKEAQYTNYASNILSFVLCIFAALLISSGLLFFVSKDALNLTMIFMFYISILTMLLPSIVLLAYIYFIVPALIIPGLTIKKYHQANSMSIPIFILILFSIFCICKFAMSYLYENNFLTQIKYKAEKISVEYSTKFLSVDENITENEKRLLDKVKYNIPFLYTTQSFYYKNYYDAKMFCESMDARIPNYLEMFNIAFNKFNTFGENYYWTSTNEEKEPFLIHFNNMSYTLEHYTDKVNPVVFCVSDMSEKEKSKPRLERKYFIRNTSTTQKTVNSIEPQESMEELALLSKLTNSLNKNDDEPIQDIEAENDKKYVSFSIKEVNKEIMQSLIKKGYVYNPDEKLPSQNKINPEEIGQKIKKVSNKNLIRLCYYPFIDYGQMTLEEESQIWKQSFCSPAFELIQYYPKTTSIYEKDSYCASIGGRLPNIPELAGILKTFSSDKPGIKYWTNNSVKQSGTGVDFPISVYFKDSRFLVPNLSGNSELAYTYCIRNVQKPSKLITNYKSRFKGLDGKRYAGSICSDCYYNEVPDTILK